MTEIYTTNEIISELKNIFNLEHDIDLADHLDISKQSLYQYKKKNHPDIQQRIISELLVLIKNRHI